MNTVAFQFCSVFSYKGSIYVWEQEKAGGPRVAVFPPIKLDSRITEQDLGDCVLAKLEGYKDEGRVVLADEWARLNKQLLDFFGEQTVGAFERRKKEVTIRRYRESGEIVLFGPGRMEISVGVPDSVALGREVLAALGR